MVTCVLHPRGMGSPLCFVVSVLSLGISKIRIVCKGKAVYVVEALQGVVFFMRRLLCVQSVVR